MRTLAHDRLVKYVYVPHLCTVPRPGCPFAPQRANDETKVWAVPVKEGTDKMADPFEDLAMKKKQRVIKNKLNQLKNLVRQVQGQRFGYFGYTAHTRTHGYLVTSSRSGSVAPDGGGCTS